MTQQSTRRWPQGPSGTTRRAAGFTLIELMIAVAVIAILASIAYPSYQKYVKEARVTDGQAKLMEVAGQLERCYTVTSDYTKRGDGSACVDFSGLESAEGYYSISASAKSGSGSIEAAGFRITATGDSSEVACTVLWVDSAGQRGSTPDGCW